MRFAEDALASFTFGGHGSRSFIVIVHGPLTTSMVMSLDNCGSGKYATYRPVGKSAWSANRICMVSVPTDRLVSQVRQLMFERIRRDRTGLWCLRNLSIWTPANRRY